MAKTDEVDGDEKAEEEDFDEGEQEWDLGSGSKLDLLLVFIPLSIVLHFLTDNAILIFFTAAVAIIPLAGLMGRATEVIAHHTTQTVGGLLNATFGNATELIIALVAVKEAATNEVARGALLTVVKASITGSIIGNILLVFGLSMLLGGLRYKVQRFNVRSAQMSASIMTLAVIGLLIPTMWHWFPTFEPDTAVEQTVSNAVAVILIVLYILSLVFSLITHKDLLRPRETEDLPGKDREGGETEKEGDGTEKEGETEKATAKEVEGPPVDWSRNLAVAILIGTTALVALMSELLIGSIEGATHTLGLTELFVGVIIIAIVGNAAEHSTAIWMAMKNKMDISLTIAAGSSAQIALLVTPILVFASLLFGSPMSLVFAPFEVVAIGISVVILNMVSLDGESNWFEGCELLAVYAILGIMFFFHT